MSRVSTDIYFVRHGESDGNIAGLFQGRGNSDLNANGILQAKAAAEALKDVPFTGACSSDLCRAAHTARLILERHPGVPLELTPELEEWNLGDYDGKPQMELFRTIPEKMDQFRFESGNVEVPGGESRIQFQQRISNCLDRVFEQYRGGCVLLVAHGWAAHRILVHVYGPPKPGMVLPVPDNTGISRFRYYNDEKRFQLITWNSVAHLKGLSVNTNPVDR